MLGCWFVVGILMIGVCAWLVCRGQRVQQRWVLLIDAGYPAARLEGRLRELSYAWAAECGCRYVWLAGAGGERLRLLPQLAVRLGFEVLSSGELRRLAAEDAANCRFYRLTASGCVYELTARQTAESAGKYGGRDSV
ncbi:MAG: hypothetical protein IJB55_04555 [Firmicutes bacterium]|nr:hypothetical protein [Bacillota bacterium]